MDRTTFLNAANVTLINGRKNAADTDIKYTEHFLSDEIHNNLRALSIIYPFSDEFKCQFEKGMFIKSNPKAFPHIIKYLLTICDPNEFKKKFCWPIYNKAAEATFRNSTMEFLNKINIKYSLGLSEIKNKILVFPGGMEFMRVIYEVSRLAMHLVLKRNGMSGAEILTLEVAKETTEILEDLCKSFKHLNEQIEQHLSDFSGKTSEMKPLMERCIENTKILATDILEDKFTENWNDVHEQIVEHYIQPETGRFERFLQNCNEIERQLSAICERELMKFNMKSITTFSMNMQKIQPNYYRQMSSIILNDRIDLNNLLLGLRLAIPSMIYSVSTCKPRSIEALTYESNYLNKLSIRLSDLILKSSQLNVIVCDTESHVPAANIENQIVCAKEPSQSQVLKDITSLFLSTPPMYNAAKRNDHGHLPIKRIALIEDITHLKAVAAIAANNESKPTPSTPNKLNPILEESMRANISNSSIFSPGKGNANPNNLDPMKILMGIRKKEKLRTNNNLMKTKTMGFHVRANDSKSDNFVINDTMLSNPDFSSTLLRNDINDHVSSVQDQLNESLNSIHLDPPTIKAKHRNSQNFNSHIDDVNQSPSGRIESTSKLNLIAANNNQSNPTKGILPKLKPNELNTSNLENDQNAANKFAFDSKLLVDDNDETLMNISDGILNNIDFNDST